ncbi:MAG: hypothetical protein HeimC3_37640 [Candidatus Heimdallarchaeota archaeon LC_3]|nr:MAG: hypothetical protein HeimC3_50750 [Candidatus Heimdallarchaeota archaeon LC_3]OLS21015.1 MAG: hypothetical protein HeimC3_37640 [Candidatus Heimdallarchaeota archaeon LC_3]
MEKYETHVVKLFMLPIIQVSLLILYFTTTVGILGNPKGPLNILPTSEYALVLLIVVSSIKFYYSNVRRINIDTYLLINEKEKLKKLEIRIAELEKKQNSNSYV